MDSVLYSKILREEDANRLVDKILNLSGMDFGKKTSYRFDIKKQTYMGNVNVLKNVYKIQDAINRKKMISFNLYIYNIIDTDKVNKKSKVKMGKYNFYEYKVSPHKVIMSNGRYYLLATDSFSEKKNIKYKIYRIDLINEIKIIENNNIKDKTMACAVELKDISKYIVENPYLFAGKTKKVIFRFDKNNLVQIVDWFGDNFLWEEEDTNTITISVKVNLQAFKFWVLQYNTLVEVLEPKEFREEIKETIKKMGEKYETKNEKEQGD